ncbi:MAG: formylmethanofuran--tetrahydromethanopterin N-formyltransferase [Candidatus Heimdallarchaeota archaeon]|nr:formylmethanofuran--tetrahydromethanopterin N-formyltransferase [Candidatus Heimdallarchaeota archaeon]
MAFSMEIKMKDTKIEDTYTECFPMWFSRAIITASDEALVREAVQNTIGFATSIIMCPAEAGVEKFLEAEQSPDGRPGAIVQIWTRKSKELKSQLLERLSQCAMTTPTTRVFNAEKEGVKSEPIGKLIAYFGDGYEKPAEYFGRNMWEIPVLDGTFLIEESFNLAKGIAGGVIILIGSSPEETLAATRKAVRAIHMLGKVITPFPGGICRAGSKIGSKYSFLNESTNHRFCPSLKESVSDSHLPAEGHCAYEIVVNARTEEELKEALQAAILTARNEEGIIKITSANYDGQLGSINLHLHELLEGMI